MENVSGMVKGKMKLVFVEILKELKASGYQVSARLLNAMYFNVPQSRERMIFIGVRNDLGIAASHPKAEGQPLILKTALTGVPDDIPAPILRGKQSIVAKLIPQGKDGSILHNHRTWFGHKKLDWNKPANTIAKESWQFYHPDRSDNFTIAELRRIHSYPDSFLLIGDWRNMSSRIGNSVPPLFMRSIARHIQREILDKPNGKKQNNKVGANTERAKARKR